MKTTVTYSLPLELVQHMDNLARYYETTKSKIAGKAMMKGLTESGIGLETAECLAECGHPIKPAKRAEALKKIEDQEKVEA